MNNRDERQLVRVHPSVIGGRGRHYGRAMLYGIEGDEAIIKPFGRHRQLERVPLSAVSGWESKAAKKGLTPIEQNLQQQAKEMINVQIEKAVAPVVDQVPELKIEPQTATPEAAEAVAPEPIVETKPTSLAAQLAEFRKQKAGLVALIEARVVELGDYKAELQREIGSVDTELAELQTELRESGIGGAYRQAAARPPSASGTMNAAGEAMFMFMDRAPGVWYTAETLRTRVETHYQVSLLLRSYIEDGRIEVRGQNRARNYRRPPR